MKTRTICLFTAAVLIMSLFSGCGQTEVISPDGLIIESGGEEISELSVIKGTEAPALTAVIDPEDYSGEVLWESSDSGVVRVSSNDGSRSCSFTTLKSGTAKISVTCGEMKATVKITVLKNPEQLSEKETAYYINDTRYSAEVMRLYYADAYDSFVEAYGNYAAYYGLDVETGLNGLDEQSCDYSSDGTWEGYFLETACSNLLYTIALCDWAEENGVSINEEEAENISLKLEALEEAAVEGGYADTDAYLADFYGAGIDTEIYEDFLSDMALANSAYLSYSDSLTYTEEELEEHYAGMGYEDEDNDYATVSMRHILVLAEEDEDGNITEEAITAAHEKAEEIYDEWLSGEATEDSFAALAEEYSEDTSSAASGGLYEYIYKDEMVDGINDWLFSSKRKDGDSTIIDNDGSYTGTHVVLFCGKGEIYSTYLARTDLVSTDLSSWLEALTGAYTGAEGADYDSISSFN